MNFWLKLLSLPSWERGLKRLTSSSAFLTVAVAPFVGAWIETTTSPLLITICNVAPFVGAWIETRKILPFPRFPIPVAPFVGAWIETYGIIILGALELCRSLRGSVD